LKNISGGDSSVSDFDFDSTRKRYCVCVCVSCRTCSDATVRGPSRRKERDRRRLRSMRDLKTHDRL